MKLRNLSILFIAFFTSVGIHAQVTTSTMTDSERQAAINRSMNERMGRDASSNRTRELDRELGSGGRTDGWGIRGGEPIWRGSIKPTKKDLEAVFVEADILKKYKDFLGGKNTGVFRLHDASVCGEETFVVNADSPCPNSFPGKATSYSFRVKRYQSKDYSDLSLENSKISIEGFQMLGMITALAKQPLDGLSLTSNVVKQLSEFELPEKKEDFENNLQKISQGVRIGDYVFGNNAQLKSGETYLLRVVAFRGTNASRQKAVSSIFDEEDKRADVIVAFQAVLEKEDRSWIILWKELSRENAPKIKF